MKHDPLNHRLLNEFPYLAKNYQKLHDGIFDLDTPSRNFYEEIFIPYILGVKERDDTDELNHCCIFIEELLNDQDENSNNLAIMGILCPLYEKIGDEMSHLPLEDKAMEYYKNWLK